jgi:hypothetical protein
MQTEQKDAPFDRVYRWGNNPKRAKLNDKRCRVLAKGSTLNAILVEFEDGERVITSWRALRKIRT